MPDDNYQYPPVAFYFEVVIDGKRKPGDNLSGDCSFQEVSGLNTELETEDIAEGGENRFIHHLPKAIKHPRLVLKRGLANKNSELFIWCKKILESDFNEQFSTNKIEVRLLGQNGGVLRSWSAENALPVSWEVEPFNSTKNDIAVEKIEFNYNILTRVM